MRNSRHSRPTRFVILAAVLIFGLQAAQLLAVETKLAEAEKLRWTGKYAEATELYIKLKAVPEHALVATLALADCLEQQRQREKAEQEIVEIGRAHV